MIPELNERSREIFRLIVDAFLETGDPVGSQTLSREKHLNLSSASIRHVMADLEALGLLAAPHTSAGRLPTQAGLRLYVDGLMQLGPLSREDKAKISTTCEMQDLPIDRIYDRASSLLSGLSSCASLVIAPKQDKPVRQIQFMALEPGKVLAIIVSYDGLVENRILNVPLDVNASMLEQASNFLTSKLSGKTFSQTRAELIQDIEQQKVALDTLTAELIKQGLALPQSGRSEGYIVVRGQSRLLEDLKAVEDLERARELFEALEEQETLLQMLDHTREAEGIQVFIGSENRVFQSQAWSTVLSPYRDSENQLVGVIGVIGPTRLNYGRIVPIVDYTAKVMERLLSGKG